MLSLLAVAIREELQPVLNHPVLSSSLMRTLRGDCILRTHFSEAGCPPSHRRSSFGCSEVLVKQPSDIPCLRAYRCNRPSGLLYREGQRNEIHIRARLAASQPSYGRAMLIPLMPCTSKHKGQMTTAMSAIDASKKVDIRERWTEA